MKSATDKVNIPSNALDVPAHLVRTKSGEQLPATLPPLDKLVLLINLNLEKLISASTDMAAIVEMILYIG